MSIILIRGYSQSGKDFVGKILCKKYGYQRFAFADSLKRLVSNKYHVPIEQLHSQQGKLQSCEEDPQKRTYRQILIDEALLVRSNDDDYFAKECCEDIRQCDAKRIVITDWRYPNELNVIKEFFPDYKINTLHVIRTSQTASPVEDHSEYQLINIIADRCIINTMDERIYQEIDHFIASL
jgi:hypothetical protein